MSIKIIKSFRKFNLRKQLTIVLSLVFVLVILLSGLALSTILRQNAQAKIIAESEVLFETIMSVRAYTNEQVRPIINANSSGEEFFPQTIPAYAVREVFNIFRKNPAWQTYFYKEATLNPTNLRDQADQFETTIIERFRQNPNLRQLTGFQSTSNGNLFYLAQPNMVTQLSCLQCHDTPEKAPKTIVERYGTVNGFGWKLHEIVGARILYVPSHQIFQKVRYFLILIISVIISLFFLTLLIVNSWLKYSVIQPLLQITKVVNNVSPEQVTADFGERFNNEIDKLTKALTRMKNSLILAKQDWTK